MPCTVNGLQHFDVHLSATVHKVLVFTNHNPLTFLLYDINRKVFLLLPNFFFNRGGAICMHIYVSFRAAFFRTFEKRCNNV